MKKIILILTLALIGLSFSACKKDKVNDITPPVITLNGAAHVYAEKGQTYVDAGATALDEVDGDITSALEIANLVNTEVEGTYTVSFNVSDKAGNKATEVVRTVEVKIF